MPALLVGASGGKRACWAVGLAKNGSGEVVWADEPLVAREHGGLGSRCGGARGAGGHAVESVVAGVQHGSGRRQGVRRWVRITVQQLERWSGGAVR